MHLSVFLILLMDHIIRIPHCSRNIRLFLSLVQIHKVMAMISSELGYDTFRSALRLIDFKWLIVTI